MDGSNVKSCINRQFEVNFGINILTHCTFLLAIIASVFFLFTSKIMSNAINNQVEDLALDNINEYYSKQTENNKKIIQAGLQQANLETLLKMYNQPNVDREINNMWIEKLIYAIVALLALVVIIAVITTKSLCGKVSILEIISENIVIFIFVGIVEFLFFTKIIVKYIPGYPSTLSNEFLQELKKYQPPQNK